MNPKTQTHEQFCEEIYELLKKKNEEEEPSKLKSLKSHISKARGLISPDQRNDDNEFVSKNDADNDFVKPLEPTDLLDKNKCDNSELSFL